MKKSVLILFLFLISLVRAQVIFCPPGAEWHYSFLSYLPIVYENEQIKYVRDSIIGSKIVKVLHHNKFYAGYNPIPPGNNLTLIKQSGDTIFMGNFITQNTWQILYNFAALPGQSWQTNVFLFDPVLPQTGTYTVSVISVSTTSVNGFNLRTMTVKFGDEQATITERFGSSNFMFSYRNYIASDGDVFDKFLCYKDDSFGLKQFTSYACDYTTVVGVESNSLNGNDIDIYPNPANDMVTLKFDPGVNGFNKAIIYCKPPEKSDGLKVG